MDNVDTIVILIAAIFIFVLILMAINEIEGKDEPTYHGWYRDAEGRWHREEQEDPDE